MSSVPDLRRVDRAMSADEVDDALRRGVCGRVASVSSDGSPYCVPLLYVWMDGRIYVHGTADSGHLRTNVDRSPRVCFEVDEAGAVFPYGRFECDTTIAYWSVIAFGTARVVGEPGIKKQFFDALLAKYAQPSWQRPKGFYPRMDAITVYAIEIERMTGKRIVMPELSQQWPARDRTMSPNVRA